MNERLQLLTAGLRRLNELLVDDKDACLEINVVPAREGGPWMQVTLEDLNFFYPFADDPTARLSQLPVPPSPTMKCTSWEANLYATFSHDDVRAIDTLVPLIDGIVSSLWSEPNTTLRCSTISLAGG